MRSIDAPSGASYEEKIPPFQKFLDKRGKCLYDVCIRTIERLRTQGGIPVKKLLSRIFVSDKAWYKMMLSIAIPMSLQALITFSVNLIDTIMLGRVGEVALSASSLGSTFFMIISVISMGIGCGSSVITAQYWGKGEAKPIRQTAAISLKICTVIALLFSVVTIAIPDRIMSIYSTDPDVIAAGAKYLRILAFSFTLSSLSTVITALLRSVNIVKVSLYASIGSCLVNVFFNYIFIFGKLGLPAMGVAGAALGTVIARVFELGFNGVYFFKLDTRISFRFRHLRGWNRAILRTFCSVSLPVVVSDLIMVLGGNLIAVIIGHIGTVMTAANAIAATVSNVVTNLFFGLSSAATILTGNTIGAGRKEDAYLQGKTYYALALLVGAVGGIILYLLQDPIISIYKVSGETREYTAQMCTVLCCMMPLLLLDHLLTKGTLRGGGDTKFLMFADTAFAYLVAAPLGALSAFVFHAPVWVIYLCLKSDYICKTILCSWRFFSKKWIKDVTVQS
jgi:putative MATE family efflux protein